MKNTFSFLLFALLFACIGKAANISAPLTLVRTMDMPDVPLGPYVDHFGVDVKGRRLFATPQARKSVQVFDIDTGKFLRELTGFGNPHGVVYRDDLNEFYVVDGAGEVKVFDGRDYRLIKSVPGLVGADSNGYDPGTKEMYIVTGGRGAELPYSAITVVDTTTAQSVGEIRVPNSSHLEQIIVEQSGSRLYVNVEDKNEVAVIDKRRRILLARWPLNKGQNNFPIALDEKHHRLFVGCRNHDASGIVEVIDTETGKEVNELPLGGNVDYMDFDGRNDRLYATCGTGNVYIYQERTPNSYSIIGKPETAVMAKTGLLVSELNLFFVGVPNLGGTQAAKILEFRIH